jgi:selenium metabolism protein YedF
MLKKVDARGFACPQPVIMTKKALEEMDVGMLEVLVDNEAAKENVARLAKNLGCEVKVKEEKGDFVVEITKGEVCEIKEKKSKTHATVFFISSDTIGKGSDELGGILMKVFFSTLLEVTPMPQKLIFMNNGVKLTVEGSEFLESLSKLEKKGVELLICGTCLDYFGLKEKIKVGRVSNFYEITETLLQAGKVIRM